MDCTKVGRRWSVEPGERALGWSMMGSKDGKDPGSSTDVVLNLSQMYV